jgi:hypothetical protein
MGTFIPAILVILTSALTTRLCFNWNHIEYKGDLGMEKLMKLLSLIAFGVSSIIYPINSSDAATKSKPMTVH